MFEGPLAGKKNPYPFACRVNGPLKRERLVPPEIGPTVTFLYKPPEFQKYLKF